MLLVILARLGPVKIYYNFGKEKDQVRKDHRGPKCSGIYCLVNLHHFGMYIGQSLNLLSRLNNYLNPAFLRHPKNSGMPICQALLKYTPNGFALIKIEYLPVP